MKLYTRVVCQKLGRYVHLHYGRVNQGMTKVEAEDMELTTDPHV